VFRTDEVDYLFGTEGHKASGAPDKAGIQEGMTETVIASCLLSPRWPSRNEHQRYRGEVGLFFAALNTIVASGSS